MKEAFDKFFQKLNEKYKKEFSTLPTVSYSKQIDQSLLVSDPDEDREVQWQPKLQEKKVKWEKIEKELGFTVRDELKAYYSTYRFLMLSGKKDHWQFNFYAVGAVEPVEKTVLQNYHDAQYFFEDKQMFILGQAIIGDNDNYFIFYDNAEGDLFCYENDQPNSFVMAGPLKDLIEEMEACL